jgi:F-type H+-transporting ATPase subunit alpha
MKSIAGHLRLELAQFEEVARFARFGADVDDATRQQIERGRRLQALLTQPPHQPLSQPAQLLILLAAVEGQLNDLPEAEIPTFARHLQDYCHKQYPELWRRLQEGDEIDEALQTTLLEKIGQFRAQWSERQNDE